MMGDSTRSSSSGLASLSRGKRSSSSPRTLSGDEAGTMLSGESLSSSLSILRKQRGQEPWGLVSPGGGRGWCHQWRGSPDILGLVVGRGGQSCQQVQALHLHSRRVCVGKGVGVTRVGDEWWQCLRATPVLTFLAVGLAGRVGVLGLLAQLLGGCDAVHHLLLHGRRGRGGQRGGRRGRVAEVVLGGGDRAG